MANNNLPKPDSKVGGYLVGEQNGKTVLHENGDKGGLLVGKRHSDGGIKAINQSTGQPIEVETLEASITSKVADSNQQYQFEGKQMTGKAVLSEINQKGGGVAFRTGGVVDNRQGAPLQYKGGEIIITRPSVLDTTKRNFNGKMMTNLEIASYINQQNGGVAFSEKDIPQSIKTNGSSYEYGGKIMKDTEIVSSCGCSHSHMETGGQVDNESQILQAFLDEQEKNVYGDAACNNVAAQFGISVSEVKNVIKNSGMITDNDEWLNSFNWDSFTISELNDYVHTISDINIHYFGMGIKANSGVNKIHDYLTKASLKNKKFTIGKVGKEMSVYKGEENLYADVVVYDAENKEYTIGLYSKDNHDGLKAIINDVVKKFEDGGKIDDANSYNSVYSKGGATSQGKNRKRYAVYFLKINNYFQLNPINLDKNEGEEWVFKTFKGADDKAKKQLETYTESLGIKEGVDYSISTVVDEGDGDFDYMYADYESDDYEKALAWAKNKSKNGVCEVFDSVSNQLVADFYFQENNYVDEPVKTYEKKYYIKPDSLSTAFGIKQVGDYYSEKTGATNDICKVVSAYFPDSDTNMVSKFINMLAEAPDKTYEYGLSELNKLRNSDRGKSFSIKTRMALQEALRLFHKKPTKNIEIKGVNYESGGKLDKPVPIRSAIGAKPDKNVVLGIDGEGRTLMIIADGYDNKGSYIGASEVLTDNDSGFYIGSGGWSDEDAERLFPNYKQRHAEISAKIKSFAQNHPTVKGMTFFDTRKGKRARIVSVTRGLVNWEYYKNDGVSIDTGKTDSLDTKQFLYLLNSGAYQNLRFVGDEKHEHGGSVAKNSYKFNKEAMKMNANAKNEVIQIVLTKYSGGVEEKEENLKRVFEMNKIPYSREAVKDIYYSDYISHGGWRDFDYYTSWIFDKQNQMTEGGRLKIKVDRSSFGDEIINAISKRSGLSAAEFNMKKAKEYLDYVNSTEGLEEVIPKAQSDYELAKKAYNDLRDTKKALGGTIDSNIEFPSFEEFVDTYTYNTSKSFGDVTHHMYNIPISVKNRKTFSSTKHTKEDAQKDMYARARYESVAHVILDELKPIFPDAKIDFSGKRKLALVEFWAYDAELPLNQKMVIVFERGGWGFDDDRSKGLINFVPEYYVYEQGDMKYPDDVVKKEFKTLGEAINYAKQFSPANQNNTMMARGGKVNKPESHAVTKIKRITSGDKSYALKGNEFGYRLVYNGIDNVTLFTVIEGKNMSSNWIDTEYFNKPEFRERGWYLMGAIDKEIIRLLESHNLNSIANEDVKSDLLKTLYIDPSNPPESDFDKYYAKGGQIDAEDYDVVDDVKTLMINPKKTIIRITHSGDTQLDLLSIEDNSSYLMSVWVDTSWFDKPAFKIKDKYSINAIKDEVIRLLKLGELNSIAKKGFSSSALKFLRMVDKEPVGKIRLADIPAELKTFMPAMQQKAIVGTTEHWEVIQRLTDIISNMPKTYETNNISANDKTVYLHYFSSGSDWYIVEKDMYSDQFQVYGYAILNGDMIDAEWGYISLPDLFSTNRVELDFYFEPITFKQLMINKGEYDDDSDDAIENDTEENKQETNYVNSLPVIDASNGLDYFKNPPSRIKFKMDSDDTIRYERNANQLITTAHIEQLKELGLPDNAIKAIFWGYEVINDNIKADAEFEGYVTGLLAYQPDYLDSNFDEIVNTVKAGFYEAGLKYPEIKDWGKIFSKFGISSEPTEVIVPNGLTHIYQYALWSNEEKGIYISKELGHKYLDNGVVKRDSFKEFTNIEFGVTLSYCGIVTKNLDTLIDILNEILNDRKAYIKDMSFLNNGMGGLSADYFIEQERNKITEAQIADEMKVAELNEQSTELTQATVAAKVSGGTRRDQYELNAEIKLLVQSKGNDRSKYSAEEIDMLKLYSGSGGLIKQGAKGTGILDQFYTPNNIISHMWGLALKYGFKFEGSNILEPAVGVGRFLQYIPKDAKPKFVLGYDVDEVAATICQVLYPEYKIINDSFETMFFQGRRHIGLVGVNTQFDLVITNPPYREYASEYAPLGEKKATGAFTFEMYFMMRGVDVLKEGGLLVMIIPSTFMANDNKYNDFKEKLAAKVDFLEAYRLPSGSFDRTEVTTDILVMRKKINTPEPPKPIKEKKDIAPSFMEDATSINTGVGSVDEQISQLKRQIANVNETLENEMEAWERKEYEQVRDDYKKELAELQNSKEPEPSTPAHPIKKKVKTWGGHVPEKDDFKNPITDEFVDGMTSFGSWGIMSPKSFAMYGTGIGAGRGQKYKKQGDDWVKIA